MDTGNATQYTHPVWLVPLVESLEKYYYGKRPEMREKSSSLFTPGYTIINAIEFRAALNFSGNGELSSFLMQARPDLTEHELFAYASKENLNASPKLQKLLVLCGFAPAALFEHIDNDRKQRELLGILEHTTLPENGWQDELFETRGQALANWGITPEFVENSAATNSKIADALKYAFAMYEPRAKAENEMLKQAELAEAQKKRDAETKAYHIAHARVMALFKGKREPSAAVIEHMINAELAAIKSEKKKKTPLVPPPKRNTPPPNNPAGSGRSAASIDNDKEVERRFRLAMSEQRKVARHVPPEELEEDMGDSDDIDDYDATPAKSAKAKPTPTAAKPAQKNAQKTQTPTAAKHAAQTPKPTAANHVQKVAPILPKPTATKHVQTKAPEKSKPTAANHVQKNAPEKPNQPPAKSTSPQKQSKSPQTNSGTPQKTQRDYADAQITYIERSKLNRKYLVKYVEKHPLSEGQAISGWCLQHHQNLSDKGISQPFIYSSIRLDSDVKAAFIAAGHTPGNKGFAPVSAAKRLITDRRADVITAAMIEDAGESKTPRDLYGKFQVQFTTHGISSRNLQFIVFECERYKWLGAYFKDGENGVKSIQEKFLAARQDEAKPAIATPARIRDAAPLKPGLAVPRQKKRITSI